MMPAYQNDNGVSLAYLLDGMVELKANEDCVITGLSLNSDHCRQGYLFLAIAGHRVHGLAYVEKAVAMGACAVLYETNAGMDSEQDTLLRRLSKTVSVPLIAVTDLSHKAGVIAERFYGNPSDSMAMVGITGTNGKTSCAQFLAKILSTDQPCGVLGTIGNGLYGNLQQSSHTTPDAVSLHALLANISEQGAASTVMEVSSHGLVQGRVAGVKFDVAVFTNISRDHLDYHGDMQQYGQAKSQLFQMESVQHAVINADDDLGRQLLRELPSSLDKIAFSIGGTSEGTVAETGHLRLIQASHIEASPRGLTFRIHSPWGDAKIESLLLGRFNVQNLLAVLGALMALDMPFEKAVQGIQSVQTISGRMERLGGTGTEPLVVVDYAHTPDALENVLKALQEHVGGYSKVSEARGRLICVFGCGGDRDKGKRPEMASIAESYADQVIVTNDNPRGEQAEDIVANINKGFKNPRGHKVILERTQAISQTIGKAALNDVILIAGKGHEDYQIFGAAKIAYEGDISVAAKSLKAINKGGQS